MASSASVEVSAESPSRSVVVHVVRIEQPRGRDLVRQKLQQPQGAAIGAVEIVEDQDQRRVLRHCAQELGDAPEVARQRLIAARVEHGTLVGQDRQRARELGDAGGIAVAAATFALGDPPEQVDPGLVGRRAPGLHAAHEVDLRAAPVGLRRDLLGGAGLADPRLAAQEHDPPGTAKHRVDRGEHALEQRRTPDVDAGRRPRERVGATDLGGLDGGQEAEPAGAQRGDVAGMAPRVAQGAAQVADGRGEGRVAHADARPERREDLLLGHDPIAVAEQQLQQLARLTGERYHLGAGHELARDRIELEAVEAEHDGVVGHVGCSLPVPRSLRITVRIHRPTS